MTVYRIPQSARTSDKSRGAAQQTESQPNQHQGRGVSLPYTPRTDLTPKSRAVTIEAPPSLNAAVVISVPQRNSTQQRNPTHTQHRRHQATVYPTYTQRTPHQRADLTQCRVASSPVRGTDCPYTVYREQRTQSRTHPRGRVTRIPYTGKGEQHIPRTTQEGENRTPGEQTTPYRSPDPQFHSPQHQKASPGTPENQPATPTPIPTIHPGEKGRTHRIPYTEH